MIFCYFLLRINLVVVSGGWEARLFKIKIGGWGTGVFMDTKFLTVKEVAIFLGRGEKWVYLNKTKIPGYFVLAKSIFFDFEILQVALKSRAKAK